MTTPARCKLGDLFELGSKTVALRDDLWCAFDIGLPLKLRVLAELADTADAIASGLRPWAGTSRALSHTHREIRETTSRLVTAVHLVELASEQIVAGLVTHGRRLQPEAEGAHWDRRLAAAASEPLYAAHSLLAQVPAACTDVVETLASVLPPADNATTATAPAERLSALQYAVLREVSLGTVSLSQQAERAHVFCDGNLHVTRATTNSLESRGLVQREVKHPSFASWRLHLTTAGRTSLLAGLASALHHSPTAPQARIAAVRFSSSGRPASPPQQRRPPSR
uniref:MarR family transcriptional regulator n=1 Tax=Streptomyces sp. NBC_00093 TaxID=2975649 RepID=A0AAU2AET2_9ACTN